MTSNLYGTLTDLDSRCPRSLVKTAPLPQGYPWVSGGRYETPELRFSGLVLDHQGLEELELKNPSQNCCFWSNLALFEWYFGSGSLKSRWLCSKPLNLDSEVTYQLPDTCGYLGGSGVLFKRKQSSASASCTSVGKKKKKKKKKKMS